MNPIQVPIWATGLLMAICFIGGWLRGSESTRRYMVKVRELANMK